MKVTPVGRKFGKYQPGESFELPDKAARVFIKVGKLAEYQAKVITPEPVEISGRTGQPKRQYRRRDLTAEE